MLKFDEFIRVFSPRLGLIRSLIAFAHLLTLTLNNASDLIPEFAWQNIKDRPESFFHKINIFCLGSSYSSVPNCKFLALILLVLVIIGYLPQITCFLHAWVAYSIFYGVPIIEGGDQIAAIITLMLIPVCIYEKRLNHWSHKNILTYKTNKYLDYFFYCCFCLIQFQIALLYLHAGIGKCVKPYWYNGSILYYWINDPMFGATEPLLDMFNFFFRSSIVTFGLTWAVLSLEFLLGASLLMNERQKRILLICGLTFHIFIFLIHGLGSFGLTMAACLLILLAPYKKPELNIASNQESLVSGT